jgi:hypothetical protein
METVEQFEAFLANPELHAFIALTGAAADRPGSLSPRQ